MTRWWLLLALAPLTPAWAAEYFLEGPEQSDRASATGMTASADGDGRRVRVVRRFSDSGGWRYLLRVDGFSDEASATEAAQSLASGIGAPVEVFVIDGKTASRVASVAPSQPEAADEAGETDGEDEADEADEADEVDWLALAAAAHGLSDGVVDALLRGPSRVVFRTTLPSGTVVDTTWATAEGAIYVEVARVKGDVTPSRTKLIGERAWLSVDGADWTDQHPEKTRLTVDGLGPAAILPFVLALGTEVEGRRELEGMEHTGAAAVDGRATTELRFDGNRTSGPIKVDLDAASHHVVRVHFGEGDVQHTYSEVQSFGAMALPRRIETRRGDQDGAKVVEIRELEVGAELPGDWFELPR